MFSLTVRVFNIPSEHVCTRRFTMIKHDDDDGYSAAARCVPNDRVLPGGVFPEQYSKTKKKKNDLSRRKRKSGKRKMFINLPVSYPSLHLPYPPLYEHARRAEDCRCSISTHPPETADNAPADIGCKLTFTVVIDDHLAAARRLLALYKR